MKEYKFKFLLPKETDLGKYIVVKGDKGDKGDTYDHTQILNDIENLKETKVDKIDGKELSSNDFTNEYIDEINTNKTNIEEIRTSLNNYSLITKTGNKIKLNIDDSFVLNASLYDENDNLIDTSNDIDLPIESLVTDVQYDEETKEIIVKLENGTETRVPVSSLVRGLVNDTIFNEEIASIKNDIKNLTDNKQNKLIAGDNISIKDDTISANGIYTQQEVDNLLEEKETKINTLNEEIYKLNSITNALPSVSGNGSNFQLTNTANAPLRDVKIYGNATQDTSNKIYKCVGDETGVYDFTYDSKIYEFTMPTITSDSILVFNANDLTLKLGDTAIKTSVVNTATGTSIKLLDTPNPDYPVEIKTITGNNKVRVCSRNLFNSIKETVEAKGVEFIPNNDGRVKIKGTTTGDFNISIVNINNMLFPKGTYTVRIKTTGTASFNSVPIIFNIRNKKNESILGDISINNNLGKTVDKTFILEKSEILDKIAIYSGRAGAVLDFTISVMIVKGNTATDYEPYQGNTYPLSLGDLELCGIGDYKDYIYYKDEKWWKHKEIEKNIVDNYSSKNQNSTNEIGVYFTGRFSKKTINTIGNASMYMISNFQKGTGNITAIINKKGFYSWLDNYGFYNILPNIQTLDEANEWITTHNGTLYFIMITPTEEEITDPTLISQLNDIRNAMTYEGETNITTTTDNGEELKIEVKAYKQIDK